MANVVVILVVVALVGWASYYIYKNKKNGNKCIGCPSSGSCSKHCTCGSNTK